MTRAERIERIAQTIYESDPEGEYQQSEVEWRFNFADQDRYRILADNALAAMEYEPKREGDALRAFLDDMDTSLHIMQQGMKTTILTTMDRDALTDYLMRLARAMLDKVGTEDMSDVVAGEMVELPTGDKRYAVHIETEVF